MAGKVESPLYAVLTASAADAEWGLPTGYTKKLCNLRKFRPDEMMKSGGTWLVTRAGMERLYGNR
ncbi:helix-turn-helix domain-containing protein [Ectobacillus ponti]|uniref:helix-turn-helix domain-containing protein n=1 Tax=Ectobacillus ponti TaxID=2961894 RepID=UPI0034D36CC9